MTSAQMLRRTAPVAVPSPPEQGSKMLHQLGDHIIKILAPPASEGRRMNRSDAEPWLLEQLALGACPTCQEHMLHMVSPVNTDVHHYTCEDKPTEHRWTIVDR